MRLRPCSLSVAAILLALPLLLASGSEATPIGPVCGTCQGSIYDLTYDSTPVATNETQADTSTWRITYTINTVDYDGGGTNLNTVALKVASSFVNATLIDAPGGAGLWVEMFGGLNAAGCSGSGSGYDCVRVAAIVNAPVVPNGTYTWVIDIEVTNGLLFTGTDQASVKARYGDATRLKVGDLVSENITLSVPEPGMTLLLAGPLLLLGSRRRIRQP